MRITPEMAVQMCRENIELKKQIKQIQRDNAFLKKCLYLALARNNYTLVIENDCDDLPETIEFDLDENVCHELIIKAKKDPNDWEFWKIARFRKI